ncbi:hypothetical protein C8A05DRAFT_37433 [Staphylotrichum tortipilum]|uniref:Uncharacterized protein n=1 Tax=Staphylotrichum tortipilum TaxID=2831512 RepID=A0AAN6MEW5_9PEZI|nr:hypothetical protein C8A05DRAFT_37433 [Staphylotrichum longicolle]
MPPYVPRKRTRDDAPPQNEEPKQKQNPKKPPKGAVAPPRKSTLFDDLDASSTPRSSTRNDSSALQIGDSEDEESSLTSLSDADFEDVVVSKRRKVVKPSDDDDDDDDEHGDVEFEDVETPQTAFTNVPVPSGDLELTLIRDTRISLANALGKKGPSKLERKIRISTHCAHVQFLLWHNAIRNAWLCDPTVQGLLLSHLPPRLSAEVDRWRRSNGLEVPEEAPKLSKERKDAKGKGKAPARKSRDWSDASQRLEQGAIDMSHGDPLFRLMKYLTAWWKQRFRVTSPGLRKWGYMSLERLDRMTKAFKQEEHDQERFGERIRDLDEFRLCAQECTGSRDVGAQLFTALLRALGLEARLVANLQPLGFGWNKLEEADPEKEGYDPGQTPRKEPNARPQKPAPKVAKRKAPSRASGRNTKAQVEDPFDSDLAVDNSDDELAIQVPEAPRKKGKVYDVDLEFPHYWTEVLSPVTNKYLPVDPIIKGVIGTNRELIEALEPRGSKADKAKQVMAYIVGHSPDGTAKDITVRYLKRQTLPGRTKGMRIPIEKVPVYNRHGKVKRYDQYDWFRSVMNGYTRGSQKHPFTEVDDEEDSTDLKPAQPEKKPIKDGEETLQYYKQSKEFVLARHLKREEALLPSAQPVKTFRHKSTKATSSHPQSEPVYSRKDVVLVKSTETWHKQGRAPLPGTEPLKRVPYRAATTNRRREIAEAEAATGEKVLQGLYSFEQTDWIIPPPIVDGVIPKNEYGNIDLFAEHMCPEGAVHVPFRGAMRVAKRLGIDFAEAVVDFEFGHRMAVPVIQGVVVAVEHHDRVMDELRRDEEEKRRKEDEKRRKAALGMWRKFVVGLRIVERLRVHHGGVEEPGEGGDEEMGGGFLPEGFEEEVEEGDLVRERLRSGFFPVVDEEEDGDDGGDVLEIDHGDGGQTQRAEQPVRSVMSTKPKRGVAAKPKASAARRRRRRDVGSDWDDDDEDEDGDGSGGEGEDE